jgi:hypothetical protein
MNPVLGTVVNIELEKLVKELVVAKSESLFQQLTSKKMKGDFSNITLRTARWTISVKPIYSEQTIYCS